jgi:hypothetical protein
MKTFLQKSMSNFTSLFSSPNNRSIAISSSIAKQLILGIFLLLFSTITNAQVIGGVGSNDDFDGDGIINSIDIDDDNDGVLDANESSSCFTTADEWNTAAKALYVSVSSELATLAPNTNFAALTDANNTTAAVQFSTATAQAQLNNELFKFTFNQPVQLDAFYIKKTTATQIFAATASSLMIQGSNDNTTWTNLLTTAIASPADATNVTANGAVSLTNSNKFTITTNAAKYKYYRIYGVAAASILSGIASEVYFDVNTAAYVPSLHPKTTCSIDTDNDGKFNHYDTDSDGDGCSDAVEAGATIIATSGVTSANQSSAITIPGPYGTNGFADGLESVVDNCISIGAYMYLYADDALYKGCTDNDGDATGGHFYYIKLGTLSDNVILVKALIPPFFFPFSGILPQFLYTSENKLTVVESKISTILGFTSPFIFM